MPTTTISPGDAALLAWIARDPSLRTSDVDAMNPGASTRLRGMGHLWRHPNGCLTLTATGIAACTARTG